MEFYIIHTADDTKRFHDFGVAVAYCMNMIGHGIEVWGSESPIQKAKLRLAKEVERNQGAYI